MKKFLISFLFLIFFNSFFIPSITVGGKSDSVLEILKLVDSAYLSLNSYADNGIVKSDHRIVRFETKYQNPNLFSFQWSSELIVNRKPLNPPYITHSIIWSDGAEAYECYHYKNGKSEGIQKKDDLSSAVAGATGVSSSAAIQISSLLNIVDLGYKITKIRNPVFMGEELVNRISCYHIKGKGLTDLDGYELFVSKSDYMVRKIIEKSPLGVTETIYLDVSTNSGFKASDFNLIPQMNSYLDNSKKQPILSKIKDYYKTFYAYVCAKLFRDISKIYDLQSKPEFLLPDYSRVSFDAAVNWRIIDPYLYFKNLENTKKAAFRINSAIEFSAYVNVREKNENIEIGKFLRQDTQDSIIEFCNKQLKKEQLGIKVVKLNLIVNRIQPPKLEQ